MTIAYVGKNTLVEQNGATSPATITYPTVANTNLLLLLVLTGNDVDGAVTTPAGWTPGTPYTGGSGTWGAGDGPRRLSPFFKESDGTESGTFNVTWDSSGGNAVLMAQIYQFSRTAGGWATPVLATGQDSAPGSGLSITTGALAMAPDDMIVAWVGGSGDSLITSPTIGATGITFGTLTEQETNQQSAGNRASFELATCLVSSGSASVAIDLGYTVFGDAMGGPGMVIRLREASGGGPATVIVGGTVEAERAGGALAVAGAASVAVGGSRAGEVAGGVVAVPGAAAVQAGGLAEREHAGSVVAVAGAVTVQPGGTSEREAAGGVIAAAGVQAIVAGGSASAERGGGLIVVPGVATVVAGGVAEQSRSGGHQIVPGVVGINLGGSAEREQAGGLSAQIGVASLAVGGRDEQERAGGTSVYGGAVQLQLGGVAERSRAGGLLMVDGTAPVTPAWPGGGTARIGGARMADVDDRIGNRRATVQKQRIG